MEGVDSQSMACWLIRPRDGYRRIVRGCGCGMIITDPCLEHKIEFVSWIS